MERIFKINNIDDLTLVLIDRFNTIEKELEWFTD